MQVCLFDLFLFQHSSLLNIIIFLKAGSMSSLENSHLYNEDLAPVPLEKRSWNMWNVAALWIGMAVCIPTYMLASSLIKGGMSWKQAFVTITLGNLIVLMPMVLNAHAGTKYGIPFPVLLRASFGTFGANIPAMLRATVACGWFGIQTWIGGSAIYTLLSVIFGFEAAQVGAGPIFGLSAGQFGCFMLFWAVNIAVILAGINCIKWLETWAAPFLLIIGLGLLYWGVSKAGGFAVIFSDETLNIIRGEKAADFDFWMVFWPSLTGMVGFWATLSLNIPDFTRYAKSQKDQMMGQLIGLPTTMALFSFIGIAVTCSTVVIFGEAIWDPVALLGKFDSKVVVGFALFALTIATLSTNIAANVVSPANDFSNLAPKVISFKMGGIITGVFGILMMPWKLLSGGAYVFVWLIGYSSLLGAIGGVMIADYFVLRGCNLKANHLYSPKGEYSFGGGAINWRAVAALVLGIAPNVPGFLKAAGIGSFQFPDFLLSLYPYAWFVSFAIAFAVHILLSLIAPAKISIDEEIPDFAQPEVEEAQPKDTLRDAIKRRQSRKA